MVSRRAWPIELKRTFRDAFFERRGIIVVKTFNVGEEVPGKKAKVQHVITPNDGKPLALGVIWERWAEPHAPELLSFAMITTAANKLISAVTVRTPAVIPTEAWRKWLGEETATADELKAILKPFEGDWDMQEQGKRQERARPRSRPDDDTPSLF